MIDVDLFSDAEPPYELEVRHDDPASDSELEGCGLNGADCVDERTYAITADRLTALLV